MPASSEFISLCQSQVELLTQGLGASLSVVYLREELTESAENKLVPVVAQPEAVATWSEAQLLTLISRGKTGGNSNLRLLLPESSSENQTFVPASSPHFNSSTADDSNTSVADQAMLYQQRIVLPLIHEGVVMGLLVTARVDRDWNEQEQIQVEEVAHTLAIACMLDQRAHWSEHDLQQQRSLQAQQHDLFDNLLHQFRNPLTAIRTFSKLLMKRLLPDDKNRSVADGIGRESDRLQELLQQFDQVLALGETNLLPEGFDPNRPMDWEAYVEPQQQNDSGRSAPPMLPGTQFLTGNLITLEPHDITEVLEPLLDSATAIAQERQITLDVTLYSDLPPVETHVRALREVLNNLLDNALKYTPAQGRAYVQVGDRRTLGETIQQAILIADTGPGIPPEDLERIFERHYRGVQANTDIPGTGLGLAIARELILEMQGDIQVFSPAETCQLLPPEWRAMEGDRPEADYSEGERPGTAFVVWLPEAAPLEDDF